MFDKIGNGIHEQSLIVELDQSPKYDKMPLKKIKSHHRSICKCMINIKRVKSMQLSIWRHAASQHTKQWGEIEEQ